jgi:hypothetical protein
MTGDSFDHEAAHANVDMGLGMIDALFIVTGDAAGLVEPAESAPDNPAPSEQLETFGIVTAAHDFQVQFAEWTQSFDPFNRGAGRAPIGPDDLQPAKEKVEPCKQRDGAIPVLDGGGSHADAFGVLRAQLQADERRRTRQRRAAMLAATPLPAEHIRFARRRGQQRIAPQVWVVIETLMAQRPRINALREQFLHTVVDEFGIAAVHETTCQRAGHAQARIDLPEQERPAIAAELAAGKIRDDSALPKVLDELPDETVCLANCGVRILRIWLHAKVKLRIFAVVAGCV